MQDPNNSYTHSSNGGGCSNAVTPNLETASQVKSIQQAQAYMDSLFFTRGISVIEEVSRSSLDHTA